MMGLGDPLTSYLSGGSNNLDPRYCLLDFFVVILDLLTTPEMQRKERSRVRQRRRFRDTCVAVRAVKFHSAAVVAVGVATKSH